jgi:hypothetical protein
MQNKKHTYQKPAEAGTLLLTADATQAGHLIKLGTTTTPPKQKNVVLKYACELIEFIVGWSKINFDELKKRRKKEGQPTGTKN